MAWVQSLEYSRVFKNFALRIALTVGFILVCSNQLLARDNGEKMWQTFRAAHPLHTQTMALSDPDASGGRVLVIAEPPPERVNDYETGAGSI